VLRAWHGREEDAAFFAVRRWRDLAGDRPVADGHERTLRELVDRSMSSGLSSDDRATLETLLRELNASISWEAYQSDSHRYFRDRRLGFMAHHLQVANEARDAE
jgi:hypothetical protein